MILLVYFLHSAIHHLRRGGQRVLVALLCIAFGVMSVVSMTLLSESLQRMMVITPPELIGADISMDRVVENGILPEHIAELRTLQSTGKIKSFTLIAYTSSLVFRLPGSGELHFPTAGMGIEPANYPLLGNFLISRPGSEAGHLRPADLLQRPGDLLVTRDLFEEAGLRIDDTLRLSDLSAGGVVEGKIRGIVNETPNHQGSKIYYSLETARRLVNAGPAENTALLTSAAPQTIMDNLKAQGWRAFSAVDIAKANQQVEQMFELSLKGAGILGMLVGGIGIANTMQVLLRRRRREVAILKTIGYQPGHLQTLFALEAALLGLLGSLIGAGLGVAISYALVGLFSGITDLLISWTFSLIPVLNGILVGFVTTIAFSLFAIVSTSQIRPQALLRSEALDTARIPWLQTLGLILLCGLPFVAVTTLVMGSLLKGMGVLLVALAGLVAMGGLLSAILFGLTRLPPLRAWPLVHMARNNLRRRGFSLVFAMVALFVGVITLGLGSVVTTSARRAYDERLIKFTGDNLTIIAPQDQEAALQRAVETQPDIERMVPSYQTSVQSIRVVGEPDNTLPPLLIGFTELVDFQTQGAPWGSAPDGVYAFHGYAVKPGSQVEVTFNDGAHRTLPVVGTYSLSLQGASPQPPLGLLMSSLLSKNLAQPGTVQYYFRVPANRIKGITAALGEALPLATVINLPAYAARFTQSFANLFAFAVAMAGLALLAGILLVANSVSLAMLDRRYEIGVLKAIGYARWQVLFILMVEYGLVALIVTATGLLLIQSILWIISMVDRLAGSLLVMNPQTAALIALFSIGLTLLTVVGITWRPVLLSPLATLNDRE